MKELSIEEKATRYDEAKERMKDFLKEWEDCGAVGEAMEKARNIFPELKENEDERIRESLLEYLHTLPNHYAHSGVCAPEWIAWLEKQESEPKWCHHEVDLSGCSEEYRKAYYDGWNNCNQQHAQLKAEQKPAAWSEEDASLCARIQGILSVCKSHSLLSPDLYKEMCDWLKNLKDRVQPQPKQELSEGDKRIIDNLISQLGNLFARKLIKEETKDKYVNLLKSIKDRVQPNPAWGEKDRRMLIGLIDELDAIMNKATPDEISVYSKYTNWLKSLKDRVQPKQEWNEEDERHLNNIIKDFETIAKGDLAKDCPQRTKNYIPWLKSLRPQKLWKPSENQMSMLRAIINEPNNIGAESCHIAMKSLYEDLMKLREE